MFFFKKNLSSTKQIFNLSLIAHSFPHWYWVREYTEEQIQTRWNVGKHKERAIMSEIPQLQFYVCKILSFPSFTLRVRFAWCNHGPAGLSEVLWSVMPIPSCWSKLCGNFCAMAFSLAQKFCVPETARVPSVRALELLPLVLILQKCQWQPHTTPHIKGPVKTKKLAGLCLSPYFPYRQIISIVPWSAKGDRCIME